MKRMFCILLVICTVTAAAQEQTLLGSSVKNGWSLGSFGGISTVNGQAAMISGFRANWIVNGSLHIGWASYDLTGTSIDAPFTYNEEPVCMDLAYRGLHTGWTFNSKKLVHWGISGFVGWGDVRFSQPESDKSWKEDYFAVMRPSVSCELNIVKWMRVNISAAYRFALGVTAHGMDNTDLSGATAGITLRFGRFL